MLTLGFDTSNYTSSVAAFDGVGGKNCSRLLDVKPGELGLRQSDALFAHIKRLPELVDALCASVNIGNVTAIGAGAFANTALTSAEIQNVTAIGAGAFACRHAFTDALAEGRPDSDDMAELAKLGSAVVGRIVRMTEYPAPVTVDGNADAPYYRPLGLDGEPKVFLKAKPKTDLDKCIHCGVCASLCPMGSINPDDVTEVVGVCIKCHSCVRNCPMGAKYFDDPAFLSHRAMLERDYTRRAEDKIFTA